MSKPRIGVLISSTRPERFGEKAARWIYDIAARRADMDFELVDLRDYPMPFFDEPMSPAYGAVKNEVARRWQRKVAEFDGFVIVAAEYNRGPTAVLKNALDYAYAEWARKPVAFVGYGSLGGARAVEQLRTIAIELQMAPTRHGVHIAGADFMSVWMKGEPIDQPYLQQGAATMLDDLAWWTYALRAARQGVTAVAA